MPEVYMDYDEVDTLAEQVGAAETELAAGRDALADAPDTYNSYGSYFADGFSAFGNTDGAPALARLHEQAREAGRTTADHLATALGEDVTRLRDAIVFFQQHDHAEADRLFSVGVGDTLTVYSAHVHAGGSEFVDGEDREEVANDYVRAGQIERLQQIVGQNPGVVGADLNVMVEDDRGVRDPEHKPHSVEAVENFEDSGYDIDAGRGDDGTHHGRHIDYVITAPGITSDDPQLVDGRPSDHNAQQVEITVPRW